LINAKYVLQILNSSIPTGALQQLPMPIEALGVHAFPDWRQSTVFSGLEGEERSTRSAPMVGCAPHKPETPGLLPVRELQCKESSWHSQTLQVCGRAKIKGAFLNLALLFQLQKAITQLQESWPVPCWLWLASTLTDKSKAACFHQTANNLVTAGA